MPDDDRGRGGGDADRPQDPWVSRLRPDPAEPPQRTFALNGLLGDSHRPGYRRLYFTRALDEYAEFATDDVVAMEGIGADAPPFVGLDSTRVTLKHDATVEHVRPLSAGGADEFDLDVRLPLSRVRQQLMVPGISLVIGTCAAICRTHEGATCGNPNHCAWTVATHCGTCNTQCGTCNTECGTCQTQCNTQCGTCQTQCAQATCVPTCSGYTCPDHSTCPDHTDCDGVNCN